MDTGRSGYRVQLGGHTNWNRHHSREGLDSGNGKTLHEGGGQATGAITRRVNRNRVFIRDLRQRGPGDPRLPGCSEDVNALRSAILANRTPGKPVSSTARPKGYRQPGQFRGPTEPLPPHIRTEAGSNQVAN